MDRFVILLELFSIMPALAANSNKPNFVIFLADDMGFSDPAVYGNPLADTPNINKLAKNGLKFTQFYSASSVGSPSRAAILTGRYPVRSGVWGKDTAVFNQELTGGLPHEEITIAEMLAEQDYKSAYIGKWHLGVGYDREFLPLQHGFDKYFGVPHTHSDCPCEICFYPDEPCDYDECIVKHAPCQLMYGNSILEQPVDLTTLSERYARAATSWIQEYSCSSTPFLLFYAFQHTQVPQFAGQRFANKNVGGHYIDSLAELDWQVGQVIDELMKHDLLENTLVIFTSDNGPDLEQMENGGFSGQMRCGKESTFEGGHRVPTILSWPGHIKSGISLELLSHLDIWPTLRRLSGSLEDDFNVVLDGIDFSNVIFSHTKSRRRTILYYPTRPDPEIGAIGIRNNQYKIQNISCEEVCPNSNGGWRCDTQPYILYDLLLDPEERHALSNDTDHYWSTLQLMTEQLFNVSSQIEFGESVLTDFDVTAQMCCDPECKPFPHCCKCKSQYSADLFPLDQSCHGSMEKDQKHGNRHRI
ncbi:arylsulfatase A-like [Antedon mediterranea]|uniref:arylsulfatase A-like n=1 Tax=Antedon mediterranea TaxID=105859 RepID=UPI003AF7AA2F